jgi:hypothetical protein
MTEEWDWTPVDIQHRKPLLLRHPDTFQRRIMIDDEDVTEWLRDRNIQWTLSYSMRARGAEPVLRFRNECDAALFMMRWV